MKKRILIFLGTRPEAIKLFPIIHRLKTEELASVTVCATAQHRQLLDQVLALAKVVPDIDLNVMMANQTLDQLTSKLISDIGQVIGQYRPDRVVVQGDTATAMTGALSSYYHRVPVSHVEAGLRSHNIYAPWPEEVNRKIVASIADQHFAPTERAAAALRAENVPSGQIYVTGNTVVDALLFTRDAVESDPSMSSRWDHLEKQHGNRRLILVTCHRRENFGDGVLNIVRAIKTILTRDDVAIVLPMHPNPNVHDVFADMLSDHPRVAMISPQEYTDFVYLLSRSYLVLTDSGGVQEEAPTFGKPVLVLRDTTERPEGVTAGTARLVGASYDRIVGETFRLLDEPEAYSSMARSHNPYGDGHASERIVKALLDA